MKKHIIFHFETAWSKGLNWRKGGVWHPNESVSPFLSMMCAQWEETNYVYRQIHSIEDLGVWARAIADSNKASGKILWLSGHGGQEKAFVFNRGNKDTEVSVKDIFKAICPAKDLQGLVVDSCSFGKHVREHRSIPKNTRWVLSTDKDVNFLESSFLFAKAVEWIITNPPDEYLKGFIGGMKTDHEKKKIDRVNYESLVETMGLRLYYMKDHTLCSYPEES